MKNLWSLAGVCVVGSMLVLAAGCASGPGGASTPAAAASDQPAVYEGVMRSFVDRAIRGDVDGLMSLSSKVTIDQMGADSLRKHYADAIVPLLKLHPKAVEGGRVSAITDSKTATGWKYERVFAGANGDEARIVFIVLKENGRIGVGYVGTWK